MREELRNRLEVLRKEFETGQGRLRDLEMQEAHLRETMLRISGAIQVLEELLAEAGPPADADAATQELVSAQFVPDGERG